MITKNQKLMLVSNFALRAKPHLGSFNLSEMLRNEHYAFDMFVQATLTGDYELIDLTKRISNVFKVGPELIKAIDSYIQNIQKINDENEFLHQSKSVLIKFANELYGIKINGVNYRQAIERLLLKVNSDERTFSINLARKFYPYCGEINPNIAKEKSDHRSNSTEQKNALKNSWDNVDNEFFYDKEIFTLGLYVEFMREKRYPERDIFISEKIAKIITIEVRNQFNPNNAYRNAVDRTQSLFDNDDLKNLTMLVSREYYNFWVGNIPKLWGYM